MAVNRVEYELFELEFLTQNFTFSLSLFLRLLRERTLFVDRIKICFWSQPNIFCFIFLSMDFKFIKIEFFRIIGNVWFPFMSFV